jgi:predicted ATPase
VIEGYVGQLIFHIPGPEYILWDLSIEDDLNKSPLSYKGRLNGPIGRTQMVYENLSRLTHIDNVVIEYMDVASRKGSMREFDDILEVTQEQEIQLTRGSQLALAAANNAVFSTLYNLREFILDWRFFSSLNITDDKIRRPTPTDQYPTLWENAGNLSAVLFYLMTEHRRIFDELQSHIRAMVPGFQELTVKARGGPGEIMAFWREGDRELTLADVSDGILRLLCWTVLCVMPNPPSLVCIDEPDQGVHPRTLPILAGLFQKASERTQILLTSHNSYFLSQFDFENIAVMRKEEGQAKFIKPADSQMLIDMLSDFGTEGIEYLHRSDQLETLP